MEPSIPSDTAGTSNEPLPRVKETSLVSGATVLESVLLILKSKGWRMGESAMESIDGDGVDDLPDDAGDGRVTVTSSSSSPNDDDTDIVEGGNSITDD
mmetsp:Transcript_27942/g.56576  ORF Transcript_27942/g.56576 Transcript_27942/m.56576 type:complete len:98 (-) Transcript_27942:866-1159(-)